MFSRTHFWSAGRRGIQSKWKNTFLRAVRNSFFFAVLLICFESIGFAEWDYQASLGARTVPFGGTLGGTLGHGILIWGEDPTPSLPLNGPPASEVPNWKFGYIRPSLSLQSNGFTSRSMLEMDLFPISIFGFTLGQSFHYRLDRATQFDCSTANCNGLLTRYYVRAQAIVGINQLALMGWAQYNWVNSSQPLPILEETSALLGLSGADQLASVTATLMYKIDSNFLAGLFASQQKFINSGGTGFTALAYGSYFKEKWGFFLGAGTYSSSYQGVTPTVYGSIQWMGKRPMGWF